MKLAASNIAWDEKNDEEVYKCLCRMGFSGLEIAPTRIFPCEPYEHIEEAREFRKRLFERYKLQIVSMQSIWFGRQENIFSSLKDYDILLDYTKKAIDFAEVLNCYNLVFGCPRNRLGGNDKRNTAISFFKELGQYAAEHNTVLAMEANPVIYNTDFINETWQAIDLVREVDSAGFRLNLDIGTMVENNETVAVLKGNVDIVNHVHLSEPYLMEIVQRKIHKEILKLLAERKYSGYVSLEMKKYDETVPLKKSLSYLKELTKR